ncbi:MAG: hypothetical protein ISS45_00465 [Candidatus Omnitrophica bacterium]|nr:hypothetical protein [Candidatus Omnitrophota bacterium]
MIYFGIFVINKNPKSSLSFAFLLICLSCVIWLFLYSLTYNLKDEKLIILLFKIAYCGITFIPVSILFYITIFVNYCKKFNFISLIYGIISSYLILKSDYLINGVKKYFWGYYPLAGIFHPVYLIFFFGFILVAFYFLFKFVLKPNLDSLKRNQIKYVLLAFIFFNFASIDFIPNYGIELYPFGYIPTILFLAIVAYAIVKHHLMDINIVFRKGLVYSILITIFTVIYLSIVILIERIFQGILGYRSLLISIIFASVIALIFIPLKNKIQSFIDRVFLGKTPEQIARENELLKQELMRSEKLKTIATFASGMAHEIKNPLTAIKTFAEYLPNKKDDSDFLEKFSKIVGSEVEKIDDLVHQLLDFSKPSPLQLKETNINKLIDDTLELLNNQFIKYNIKISKDYSDSKMITVIDQNQMKQVFLNLFLNSIEAMPKGGTLTIATTNIRDNSCKKQFVEIRVQDTGCGIPEKDIPHIFEPFYTTKEKGTGLGLSLVYNIIKQHKGEIYAESRINQGSSFIIKLPIE